MLLPTHPIPLRIRRSLATLAPYRTSHPIYNNVPRTPSPPSKILNAIHPATSTRQSPKGSTSGMLLHLPIAAQPLPTTRNDPPGITRTSSQLLSPSSSSIPTHLFSHVYYRESAHYYPHIPVQVVTSLQLRPQPPTIVLYPTYHRSTLNTHHIPA